jgi:hypothetical protein
MNGAHGPSPALADARLVSCHAQTPGQGSRWRNSSCQRDPSLDGPCLHVLPPRRSMYAEFVIPLTSF